jgi:hypothetical protein
LHGFIYLSVLPPRVAGKIIISPGWILLAVAPAPPKPQNPTTILFEY